MFYVITAPNSDYIHEGHTFSIDITKDAPTYAYHRKMRSSVGSYYSDADQYRYLKLSSRTEVCVSELLIHHRNL